MAYLKRAVYLKVPKATLRYWLTGFSKRPPIIEPIEFGARGRATSAARDGGEGIENKLFVGRLSQRAYCS
jgi:hypothetical protein